MAKFRILLAIFGAGLAVWVWGRTGDILGDFGHELYFAWQLSLGRVFGRELIYLYGPLSPWINSWFMRIFGPGLNVILLANLLVLVLVTILLHGLLVQAFDELTACLATMFFLVYFGLGSATFSTNYNFLTPYAHGATHGLLICLAAAHSVIRFERSGRTRWPVIGALLTGAAFLTKPEIFLACAATFSLGVAGACRIRRQRMAVPTIVVLIAAILAAPLAAWLDLVCQMPASAATAAVLGGWQYVFTPAVTANPFCRWGMGTDDVSQSLTRIAAYGGIDAAAIILLACIALLIPRRIAWLSILPGAAALAILLEAAHSFTGNWSEADRPLILFAAAAAYETFRRMYYARTGMAAWCQAILSLSLLAKIFLNVRTDQYGFVLAAPCAAFAAAALIGTLPNYVQRLGGNTLAARSGAMGLLAGLAIHRLSISHQVLLGRTVTIPLAFGGVLYARPIDQPAADAVIWLEDSKTVATAAILPDASGIAYAAGKSNAAAYDALNPLNLAMWGETAPQQAFEKNPPDAILIAQMDTGFMGAQWFGEDYANRLMHWIAGHYSRTGVIGDPQWQRSIVIWQRTH